MTITIPVWLLWTFGIALAMPVVGIIGYFAVLGWMMRKAFSK